MSDVVETSIDPEAAGGVESPAAEQPDGMPQDKPTEAVAETPPQEEAVNLAEFSVPISDPETGEALGEWSYSEMVDAYRNREANPPPAATDAQTDMARYIPVLEQVDSSPLAQYIVYHRIRGFSDDEILRHLSQVQAAAPGPAAPQADAQQPGQAQEAGLWQEAETEDNEADNRIAQLQQEIASIRQEQSQSQVSAHNDQVLYNALIQGGHNPNALSDEHRKALHGAVQNLLPGIDLMRYRLSPTMAQAMVERGLGAAKAPAPAPTKPNETLDKLRQLPHVAPAGGGGRSPQQPRTFSENGYSRTEKRRRMNEFARTGKLPL